MREPKRDPLEEARIHMQAESIEIYPSDREHIAKSLGIGEKEYAALPEADRLDIEEFISNAYDHGYGTAQREDPDRFGADVLPPRVLYSGSVLRHHDWVHYAESLWLTGGKEVDASYADVDKRERHFNKDVLLAELYSSLFIPISGSDLNWGRLVMTGHDSSAEEIIRMYESGLYFGEHMYKAAQNVMDVYATHSSTTNWRDGVVRYEASLKLSLMAQALSELRDVTAGELQHIEDAFDELQRGERERPAHYLAFAQRVFSGEFETNRRLFVDEILEKIRLTHAL